jgi:hypothetical protein
MPPDEPAPALPAIWQFKLSCGCTYSSAHVPDLASPVVCPQQWDGDDREHGIVQIIAAARFAQ